MIWSFCNPKPPFYNRAKEGGGGWPGDHDNVFSYGDSLFIVKNTTLFYWDLKVLPGGL